MAVETERKEETGTKEEPPEDLAFRRMLQGRLSRGEMTQREFETMVGILQRSDSRKEAKRPRITVEQLQTALEDNRRRRVPLRQWLKSVGPAVYVMAQTGRGKGNIDKWLVSQLAKAGVSEADLPKPDGSEPEPVAPQQRAPASPEVREQRRQALTKARAARAAKKGQRRAN